MMDSIILLMRNGSSLTKLHISKSYPNMSYSQVAYIFNKISRIKGVERIKKNKNYELYFHKFT